MRAVAIAIMILMLGAVAAGAKGVRQHLYVPGLPAQLGYLGLTIPGSGGPPPSCSNSLDFSDACNSQYVGLM